MSIDGAPVVYDALGRQVEFGTGTYQKLYQPGANMQIAVLNGQTLVNGIVQLPGGGRALYSSSGLWLYEHSDWLGSARVVSTPTRTLNTDSSYAPFGENYNLTGSSILNFTGITPDTASGLYDFLYRKYSPVQSRWISPDPSGLAAVDITNPQTWNRYAYVANNPLSFVDPLGLNQDACTARHPCSGGGGAPGSTNDPDFSFSPGGNGSVWASALGGSLGSIWQFGLLYSQSFDAGLIPVVDQEWFITLGVYGYSLSGYWSAGAVDVGGGSSGTGWITQIVQSIKRVSQCAAPLANTMAASRLTQGSRFQGIGNVVLGNDASTVSGLVFGPDRSGSALDYGIGQELSLATRIGLETPVDTGRIAIGESGGAAGRYFGKSGALTQPLAETLLGKVGGGLLRAGSELKFVYDAGVFVGAAYVCRDQF